MRFGIFISCAALPLFLSNLIPPACAQQKKESAGLVNDWLREESSKFRPWDFGGQARGRYEVKENAGSFPNRDFIRNGQDNDNSYLLLREKIHVGYRHDWFNVFVEGRDSSTTGDDRAPNPEADQFDLHQAFLILGNPKTIPLSLKIGRQEMSYGDERFVGVSDWNNLARVFDAAKLRYENPNIWIDGFVGRLIVPDDDRFNEPNDYDWFSGAYASTPTIIPKQETQLYFLARNVGTKSSSLMNSSGTGPTARDVYTIGARVRSLPGEFNGWDYGVELAGQGGNVTQGGRRIRHHAFAAFAGGGYTWSNAYGAPRFGFDYSYGSGDSDATDGKNETFDLLFGTNHKLYGYMDLVGLRNLHSPSATFTIKPMKNLLLRADYFLFWMADTHDLFYPETAGGRNQNGYGINSSFDSFVGSELEFVANYSWKSWLNFQAGYGHFFVGDYIRQSVSSVPANDGAVDADWFFLQTAFTF